MLIVALQKSRFSRNSCHDDGKALRRNSFFPSFSVIDIPTVIAYRNSKSELL